MEQGHAIPDGPASDGELDLFLFWLRSSPFWGVTTQGMDASAKGDKPGHSQYPRSDKHISLRIPWARAHCKRWVPGTVIGELFTDVS
jgi:hypothetical protein